MCPTTISYLPTPMIKEFRGFPELNHYMLISGMRLVLGIRIRGFSGIYPDIPQNSGKGIRGKFSKASRVYWGPNSVKCWGISGRNSPKNFDFQGGDGDNDFGKFANSNTMDLLCFYLSVRHHSAKMLLTLWQ